MPLLRASDHGLPDDATIAVPVPPEGLTLYRLVNGEAATVRDFEERRTRPQAERDGIPELFRLSVSHWFDTSRLRRTAFVAASMSLK